MESFINLYQRKDKVLGTGLHSIDYMGLEVWPSVHISVPSAEYAALITAVKLPKTRIEAIEISCLNCLMCFPDKVTHHAMLPFEIIHKRAAVIFSDVESDAKIILGRAIWSDDRYLSDVLGNYGVTIEANLAERHNVIKFSDGRKLPDFEARVVEVKFVSIRELDLNALDIYEPNSPYRPRT